MGLQGVIFGVIAALWLVFLLPYFLRNKPLPLLDEGEPELPFSASVTIVRRGASLAEAEPGSAVVTTPLTRRAALRELTLLDELAASRRRRVLLFLMTMQVLVGVFVILGFGAWWTTLIPAGLLLCFVVVARWSVQSMRADFAQRAERIKSAGDEETVAIAVMEEKVDDTESIELSAPISRPASLWDPIPITAPTYVSKPLAPRTVRTIDLSAPVPAASALPVIADAPEGQEKPEARGETAAG